MTSELTLAYAPRWRVSGPVDYLLQFPHRHRCLMSVNLTSSKQGNVLHTLVKHTTHLATPGIDDGMSSAGYVAFRREMI